MAALTNYLNRHGGRDDATCFSAKVQRSGLLIDLPTARPVSCQKLMVSERPPVIAETETSIMIAAA